MPTAPRRASAAKSKRTRSAGPASPKKLDGGVDAFLAALDHPLKPQLETLRRVIRSVSPTIGEGIKWNAPSFHTADHFATFMLRDRDRLQLILHAGAKAKDVSLDGVKRADADGALEWLGKERARVVFLGAADVKAKTPWLKTIVRAWISAL